MLHFNHPERKPGELCLGNGFSGRDYPNYHNSRRGDVPLWQAGEDKWKPIPGTHGLRPVFASALECLQILAGLRRNWAGHGLAEAYRKEGIQVRRFIQRHDGILYGRVAAR